MGDEPDLDTRLHGTPERSDRPVAGRQLGEVVAAPDGGGPAGRVGGPLASLVALARRRPVLLVVGAGVAGFVLARLIQRAVRR
jgi:hypothetical protein